MSWRTVNSPRTNFRASSANISAAASFSWTPPTARGREGGGGAPARAPPFPAPRTPPPPPRVGAVSRRHDVLAHRRLAAEAHGRGEVPVEEAAADLGEIVLGEGADVAPLGV